MACELTDRAMAPGPQLVLPLFLLRIEGSVLAKTFLREAIILLQNNIATNANPASDVGRVLDTILDDMLKVLLGRRKPLIRPGLRQ